MKTINIKGKEYVPVVERVKEFHKLYPDGDIQTHIVNSDNPNRVIIKATVNLGKVEPVEGMTSMYSRRIFTGYSQAEWGKGMMGDVALEIAETSAIGRALGFANIGLIDGITSADEMRKVKTYTEDITEIKKTSAIDMAKNELDTCISKESRDALLAKMLKSTKLTDIDKINLQDYKTELDELVINLPTDGE